MRHPDRSPQRLLARMAGVSLACLALGQPARAQFSGDYFDPYRAAYRSSTLPVQTRIVPGQVRTATPPGLGTVPGIGTPFDLNYSVPEGRSPLYGDFGDRLGLDIYDPITDVYRQYDEEFGRVYRPNAGVDDRFRAEQQERQRRYIEAMRETDPQRRAELMRQYQQSSRRASLGLSASASRGALNAQARREELSPTRRGAVGAASGPPQTVRSYEDLIQWSRVVNRQALRAGVVRPDSN